MCRKGKCVLLLSDVHVGTGNVGWGGSFLLVVDSLVSARVHPWGCFFGGGDLFSLSDL